MATRPEESHYRIAAARLRTQSSPILCHHGGPSSPTRSPTPVLTPHPLLASLLYLLGAVLTWIGTARQQRVLATTGSAAAAVGLVLQLFALTPALLQTEQAIVLTLADAAAMVGAVVATVGLISVLRGRLQGAAAALWLTAAVLAVGSGSRGTLSGVAPMGYALMAHILLSALAAGLLSVAAVLVVLLTAQNARLRERRPLGMLAALPPLEALESAVFNTVLAGFMLLSLSLLSGFLFIQDLFGQHLVHKTFLSIVAWCIFGTLLVGRHRFGWRGRQALRFLLTGYVILATAYFGSRFVLEGLLGRHWG